MGNCILDWDQLETYNRYIWWRLHAEGMDPRSHGSCWAAYNERMDPRSYGSCWAAYNIGTDPRSHGSCWAAYPFMVPFSGLTGVAVSSDGVGGSSLVTIDADDCSDFLAFNQPIGDWDTSGVLELNSLSRRKRDPARKGTAIGELMSESPISSCASSSTDTTATLDMQHELWDKSAHNQPTDDCDISNVTTMQHMERDNSPSMDCEPRQLGINSTTDALPPYFDWLSYVGALSDFWLSLIRSNGLRISSVFSGIGSEQKVASMLLRHMVPHAGGLYRVVHTASFELLQSARDILRCTSPCPLFGDVTLLLPDHIRIWANKPDMSIERLKERIVDGCIQLRTSVYCYREQRERFVDMGDIVVSGIPCVDYSTYGSHRGLTGPTSLLVIVWVRLIQQHSPMFVVIEEVKPFLKKCLPLLLRADMLGSLYSFHYEMLDPRLFNLPVSRPRLYCILVRKHDFSLMKPMSDIRGNLPAVVSLESTGLDYYFDGTGAPLITANFGAELDGIL